MKVPMEISCRSRLSNSVAITILALIISAVFVGEVYAQRVTSTATVRGKIQRQQQSRTYPASYVRVTLTPRSNKSGRSLSFTGNDGMYYFRDLQSGTYLLEVWASPNKRITSRDVVVPGNMPYIDVPVITIS
jgi:hypothetical protein